MEQSVIFDDFGKIDINERIVLDYSDAIKTSHSINAEYYARSLLGFNKAFKSVNKNILGLEIDLQIRAEEHGSFEAIVDFFTLEKLEATATILAYLSYFGLDFRAIKHLSFSLFKYIITIIKRAKGKKEFILEIINEMNIPADQKEQLIKLIASNYFRLSLDEMTAFLEINNMQSLKIEQKSHTYTEITKSDRPYFVTQPEDEETVEIDRKEVSITYLSPEKNRWQFKSGALEFWADVMDEAFVENMKNKILEDISDYKFLATVRTITIKEAFAKRKKMIREIKDFAEQKSLY